MTTSAPGRNAPCACGSGRKAKRCHPDGFGRPARPVPGSPAPVRGAGAPSLGDEPAAPRRRPHDDALDRADDSLEARRIEEAIAIAGEVLVADPANGRALGVAGAAAHRLGDTATARSLLTQAVALRPEDPQQRRRLAALLGDLGQRDEAERQLLAALAAAPADGPTRLDLAALQLAAGQPDRADAVLVQAIELDPGNRSARRRLTWLRMREDRLADAEAAYRAFVDWEAAHPELVISDGRGHRIHAGRVSAVAPWCREHGAPYAVASPAGRLAIARPHYVPDPVAPAPAVVTRPERYAARLEEALVVGRETLVVTREGTILSDVATHPDVGRYDLVRGATRYADPHRALLDLGGEPIDGLDRAVALTAPGSPNWYHWLLEILTRLQTLDGADPEAATWPLILDEAAARVPQLVDALRMLVGPDRPLVSIPVRHAVRVRQLAIASPGAWLPIDLRDGLMLEPRDCVIDPASVEYLRRRLMPETTRAAQDAGDASARGTRRLFLGRSREGRMLGAAALEPVLARHGVETVLPERLSVAEQVALFATASLIVAESGAALTNLVFAPPDARILVLGADRWDLTLFSQLAGHRGQVHRYVAGVPVPGSAPKLYQSRFTMPPDALDAALDAIGAAMDPVP